MLAFKQTTDNYDRSYAERDVYDGSTDTPYRRNAGCPVTLRTPHPLGVGVCQGNTEQIFEIKSTKDLWYMLKVISGRPHHRAQLQCYLQTMNCADGALIYVERGDVARIKQFDETYDDTLWEQIKNHFSEISEAMNALEPPKPIPVGEWECAYCEYREKCSPVKKMLKHQKR